MKNEQWGMQSFKCGTVAIVVRGNSVCRILFETSPQAASAALQKFYPQAEQSRQSLIQEGLKQFSEYFLGERRTFKLPLDDASLSAFAGKVRQALLKVPYGSLVTYGELATLAGSPGAARAVGTVMSSNPLPMLVPCHRVVPADGSIGQYSGAHGSRTKAWLIDFEQASRKS